MCQVYATGYQQRHPEWRANPMLDCPELMATTFGRPLPSLVQMLRSNPVAALEHFWWNVTLVPAGLQVLLFNATSGAVNPDYFPVRLRSRSALVLSVVMAGILATGSLLLWTGRSMWWEFWLRDRALGWLAMLSVAAVALVIVPTQRPRPSYLFCQGISAMAFTGMCVFAIAHRWPAVQRLRGWLPVVMAALLIGVPAHYVDAGDGARPLLALYERLAPFSAVFNRADTVFLVSAHPIEIHDYVGHNYFTSPLIDLDYTALDRPGMDRALPSSLDQLGVNLVYVDEALWRRWSADPAARSFVSSPGEAGWKVIGLQDTATGRWMLLQRQ